MKENEYSQNANPGVDINDDNSEPFIFLSFCLFGYGQQNR